MVSEDSDKENLRKNDCDSYSQSDSSDKKALYPLNLTSNFLKGIITYLASKAEPRNNSNWITIYLILNTMIGSGILNKMTSLGMPQSYRSA